MNPALKKLLLWIVMLALPLRGVAAIDTACARVSPHAPAVAVTTALATQVGHAAHAPMHEGDGIETAAKGTSVCGDAATPHKVSTCSGGVCHIGAAAPPSSLDLVTLLERTEVAPTHPAVSFVGEIPAGLERPPRHLVG